MSYLRGFAPWIAFALIGAVSWQWGALLALLCGVGLLLLARRSRFTPDSQILEISTVAYFAALTAVAFSVPDSALRHYTGPLAMGWLALTAFGTLAIGTPFTLGIAKRQAPRELWDSPVFKKVNQVLTTVWATAFAVTALTLLVLNLAQLGAVATIPVQVAGFIIPASITHGYPQRVRARYADRAHAGTTDTSSIPNI
jgi:hypothetical protein